MINNECKLLTDALCYEQGHSRRTQHLLKVYALTKLIAESEFFSFEQEQIVRAAAILHDIAIKYCKDNLNGDASQENQRKYAKKLVHEFLTKSNYLPSYIPKITYLVENHHNYNNIDSKLLQVLIEADLIINCYEGEKVDNIENIFKTKVGKKLFDAYLKGAQNEQ